MVLFYLSNGDILVEMEFIFVAQNEMNGFSIAERMLFI